MSANNKQREIRRIRRLLEEIASIAEDEELQGGLPNAVRRYNAIVNHLVEKEWLPIGLFPALEERQGAVNFDQVGVESRLLSGYLEEMEDEEEDESEGGKGKIDFGPIIALAPFLGHDELNKIVRTHLRGDSSETEAEPTTKSPNLRTIVGLAPHMDKKELGDMVRACLSRQGNIDPGLIVALAPHIGSQELGKIVREYLPDWFRESRETHREEPAPFEAAPPFTEPPPPPAPPEPPKGEIVSVATERRLAEVNGMVQEAVNRLRQNNLNDAERTALLTHLASLTGEQVRLTQQRVLTS